MDHDSCRWYTAIEINSCLGFEHIGKSGEFGGGKVLGLIILSKEKMDTSFIGAKHLIAFTQKSCICN